LFSLPTNSLKEMPTQICFGNYLSVSGSSVLYKIMNLSYLTMLDHLVPIFFYK
jgi:hypothetical protein